MWCKYAPLSYLPKTPLKSLSGRLWKNKKANTKCFWWGFIHIDRSRESFEELTFVLQKLIKSSDRWLIKEWMIGDSVITVLSCNHPITWKSYMPHRDQGKGWIKSQLIWITEEYYVIGMALMKYIRHSSNSRSTTKYLAICSGRAKVKLGGFCWRSLTTKYDCYLR